MCIGAVARRRTTYNKETHFCNSSATTCVLHLSLLSPPPRTSDPEDMYGIGGRGGAETTKVTKCRPEAILPVFHYSCPHFLCVCTQDKIQCGILGGGSSQLSENTTFGLSSLSFCLPASASIQRIKSGGQLNFDASPRTRREKSSLSKRRPRGRPHALERDLRRKSFSSGATASQARFFISEVKIRTMVLFKVARAFPQTLNSTG